MTKPETVLEELLACCKAWEQSVCVMGNVRAGDAAEAIEAVLSKLSQQPKDVQGVEPVVIYEGKSLYWISGKVQDDESDGFLYTNTTTADQLSAAREEGRRQGLEEAAKKAYAYGVNVSDAIRSIIK